MPASIDPFTLGDSDQIPKLPAQRRLHSYGIGVFGTALILGMFAGLGWVALPFAVWETTGHGVLGWDFLAISATAVASILDGMLWGHLARVRAVDWRIRCSAAALRDEARAAHEATRSQITEQFGQLITEHQATRAKLDADVAKATETVNRAIAYSSGTSGQLASMSARMGELAAHVRALVSEEAASLDEDRAAAAQNEIASRIVDGPWPGSTNSPPFRGRPGREG